MSRILMKVLCTIHPCFLALSSRFLENLLCRLEMHFSKGIVMSGSSCSISVSVRITILLIIACTFAEVFKGNEPCTKNSNYTYPLTFGRHVCPKYVAVPLLFISIDIYKILESNSLYVCSLTLLFLLILSVLISRSHRMWKICIGWCS